jgi:hypothetical protein
LGGAVVLLLGLSQIVLPRLAAQRVRDQVEPYGSLRSVSVSAFPAIELLWGKAETIRAAAHSLTLTEAQAVKLIWEARGVRDASLAADTLRLAVPGLPEGVVLRGMSIRKRGDRLSTEATVTEADLDMVSPGGFQLHPLASAPGTVKVRASGSLFGVRASVDALVAPREGRLIAQPLNIPFGGFVALTLFADPHLYLDGISLAPESPLAGRGRAWRVSTSAHLR